MAESKPRLESVRRPVEPKVSACGVGLVSIARARARVCAWAGACAGAGPPARISGICWLFDSGGPDGWRFAYSDGIGDDEMAVSYP